MATPSSLNTPPPKNSEPTRENVAKLAAWLNSLIAGHAGAKTTYTFYEEVDKYLGPWGKTGYPIGYGKKYNVLFSQNKKLNADPTARKWVWETTIKLQEELRDFILKTYREGKLGQLNEGDLRQAAFNSHPRAYTNGGLTLVIMICPELLPEIASIPMVEFSYNSTNRNSSWKQVGDTIGLQAPRVIGTTLALMAGPAHNGLFRNAMRRDQQNFQREMMLGRMLGQMRKAVVSNKYTRVSQLKEIIARLNQTQFPDQQFAREAGRIVEAAQNRICVIVHQYQQDIKSGRESREVIDRIDPGWSEIACRM